MINIDRALSELIRLKTSDLQWLAISRKFDPSTPMRLVDEWISWAKRELVFKAYEQNSTVIADPEVLRERGGGGIGVRIRALVMPLIGGE